MSNYQEVAFNIGALVLFAGGLLTYILYNVNLEKWMKDKKSMSKRKVERYCDAVLYVPLIGSAIMIFSF